MGIFDSTSKKKTVNISNQYDQKVAADAGSIGVSASENVTVNHLDGGAISEAFDFGSESLGFGGQALDYSADSLSAAYEFGSRALNLAQDFGVDALESVGGAITQVNAANRSDSAATLDTITKAGAVVLVAFFAFMIFKKG